MPRFVDVGQLIIDVDRVVAIREPSTSGKPPLAWLEGIPQPVELSVEEATRLKAAILPPK
jgi:hypothetical protein